jgi:hypothetical protein
MAIPPAPAVVAVISIAGVGIFKVVEGDHDRAFHLALFLGPTRRIHSHWLQQRLQLVPGLEPPTRWSPSPVSTQHLVTRRIGQKSRYCPRISRRQKDLRKSSLVRAHTPASTAYRAGLSRTAGLSGAGRAEAGGYDHGRRSGRGSSLPGCLIAAIGASKLVASPAELAHVRGAQAAVEHLQLVRYTSDFLSS